MSNVIHRGFTSKLPVVAKGDGPYLYDSSGKKYIDGSSGAAVSCLGHNNQDIIRAIVKQVETIPFAHTAYFTSTPMENLAQKLIEVSPKNINHVAFSSGGSEAIETALKIAKQYWEAKGENKRQYFIAREQSYHGATLGALSVGGNKQRRKIFNNILSEKISHIPACYEYRYKSNTESQVEYGLKTARFLQEEIETLGKENVIAFIAEPVVGATLGTVTAVPGYFKEIKKICTENDILLILDEIMCGTGRTGTMFACEQEDILPDIITMAKGLGAGYQPIAATLTTDNIYETIKTSYPSIMNGFTYMGHTTATAAANAVLDYIYEHNLLDAIKEQGQYLSYQLKELFNKHPNVGDIRGRGLFYSLEFVENKEKKSPFQDTHSINNKIKYESMNNGLICYPMSGTIDGQYGNHVMLAPPYICTQSHIDEIIDKFRATIEAVF